MAYVSRIRMCLCFASDDTLQFMLSCCKHEIACQKEDTMPALQVKDFPNDLYEELRECATAQDRNISQQTVHVLREYLRAYRQGGNSASWVVRPAVEQPETPPRVKSRAEETPEERIERRRKAFEAIDAMPKFEVPDDFPEPAELIRQMREERTEQITSALTPFQ